MWDTLSAGLSFVQESGLELSKSSVDFCYPGLEGRELEKASFTSYCIAIGFVALKVFSRMSSPMVGGSLLVFAVIYLFQDHQVLAIAEQSLEILEDVAKTVEDSYQKIMENFPVVLEKLDELKEQNKALQGQISSLERKADEQKEKTEKVLTNLGVIKGEVTSMGSACKEQLKEMEKMFAQCQLALLQGQKKVEKKLEELQEILTSVEKGRTPAQKMMFLMLIVMNRKLDLLVGNQKVASQGELARIEKFVSELNIEE